MSTRQVDYSSQPGLIPANHSDLIPTTHPPSAYEAKSDTFYNPHYAPEVVPPPAPERRVCGLCPTKFWLLLALATMVIGAAIGGGVGGSMAVNNARTQCLAGINGTAAPQTNPLTNTPTTATQSGAPTPTQTNPIAAGTTQWGPLQTVIPYTGCPGNNGNNYTSYFPNSTYKISCGLDIPYANDSDLMYVITPTFQLCMEACSSWNDAGTTNGGVSVKCAGVAFIPSHVNGDARGMPANCVLKSTRNPVLKKNDAYNVDSAVLL